MATVCIPTCRYCSFQVLALWSVIATGAKGHVVCSLECSLHIPCALVIQVPEDHAAFEVMQPFQGVGDSSCSKVQLQGLEGFGWMENS